MTKTTFPHHALLVFLLSFVLISATSHAATPQDGYFYGVDMDPVDSASISAVETEPAIALIFAVDQKTAEITKQFDAWYQSTDRPQVAVYAIGVLPEGMSRDVAITAIQQRNLHMPVFLANSDMLLGEDFRLLVLNNDMEMARFLTLDWADAYDTLAKAGVTVTSEPPAPETPATPAAPTATPALTPTPAPTTPTVTPSAPVTTPPTTSTTITPTQPTPDQGEPLVLGGDGSDGIYINKLYGIRVQFPPDWKYRVSGKRDGAVAIPPPGGKMDMRIWATPAGGMSSPQDYVDQRLESIAKSNHTRVQIERRVWVTRDGKDSVDITFTYTRPLDENAPQRGGLIWRGRLFVTLDNGLIKAASANAPSGEFMSAFPFVDSFIRSFRAIESDKNPATGYSSPNVI